MWGGYWYGCFVLILVYGDYFWIYVVSYERGVWFIENSKRVYCWDE